MLHESLYSNRVNVISRAAHKAGFGPNGVRFRAQEVGQLAGCSPWWKLGQEPQSLSIDVLMRLSLSLYESRDEHFPYTSSFLFGRS